jgi:hypothetical protein
MPGMLPGPYAIHELSEDPVDPGPDSSIKS